MITGASVQRTAFFCSRRLNSTVTKEVATISSTLYKDPSKWIGLDSKDIITLHNERKARLGPLYKPCEEELKALLPTAEASGIPAKLFKEYYHKTPEEVEAEMGIARGLDEHVNLDQYQFDDLPSQSQILVHQHREQRFYNRLAAFELPLLAQYRQEYKRPSTKTHPVAYRYTTYLGEEHPNSRKVVLSVKTSDLGLEQRELHKLRLLAKTRYDSTTDTLRMSSDRYEEPAQNAKYLNSILLELLKEAKDLKDDFADVPLDKRHIIARQLRKKKRGYEFPEEWKRPQDAPRKTVDLVELLHKQL
ncbi:mitochondrial 37S ribosomal protein mS35 [Kluyveromyces lactis]|uniref:Small ribosomal subunit protein mS35 n=1 Tax=Kluyveromyces lactis (strain ATCC 8585 / CBS 2359 / DSM 70799 / NBRC 1267 / NRRL Y-1140 / WM37) TaxID=284590 RepID=Q6CQD0_KLULA|nr:mitochondrial 37S ribosomal protein RSM24 [Kluyveromyces lactis]CAH00955.1 KLLA0D18051p [Kluyveromyces lactis]|eukprot:XP_453859.1 mitochondrial 37S ribosomal protein RSM24 [Kluyveromyces lactis]